MGSWGKLFVPTFLLVLLSGQSFACEGIIDGIVQGCLADCQGLACDCTSCAQCEGCAIEPIPGGFAGSNRVPNAVQIRLTDQGLAFIETQGPALVSSVLGGTRIEVPPIDESGITACTTPGTCFIDIGIPSLSLEPMPGDPDVLRVNVSLDLTTVNASGAVAPLSVGILGVTCLATFDTGASGSPTLDLQIDVALDDITEGARTGYSHFVPVGFSGAVDNDDLTLAAGGGIGAAIICGIGGAAKGTIVTAINNNIADAITILGDLCQAPTTAGCPTGSTDVDGTCIDDATDECVPLLLGIEGRMDLGAALAGLSSSAGTLDFLVASQGEWGTNDGGISLNLFGGAHAQPPSDCVPHDEVPAPSPMVPEAPRFHGVGEEGEQIAIGVSESFVNYAADGIWRSGGLCLEVGTRQVQFLSTSLISLLINSLGSLTFPDSPAALGVAVHPGRPPVITFGDRDQGQDLIHVSLEQLELDFYLFSADRFERFMTMRGDVAVGVDLAASGTTLTPAIGGLTFANLSITNSELLSEDPVQLAATLQGLLGSSLITMLLGPDLIGPIEIPPLAGITLSFDEMGRIESGGEAFLGIMASLATGSATLPLTARANTTLEVMRVAIPDRGALNFDRFKDGTMPVVEIALGGTGAQAGAEYEYSYQVDGGNWSAWSSTPYAVVDDPALWLQAVHRVRAIARIEGEQYSMDLSPAVATFTIDALPPRVELRVEDGGASLLAADVITPTGELAYRWRRRGGDWSDWQGFAQGIRLPDASAEVEVRDLAGNVGSNTQSLRGLPPPDGGCACTVPGTESGVPVGGLVSIALVAMAIFRRRRS